jgi:glycosyltransferase involved in cell wall biosynthesis
MISFIVPAYNEEKLIARTLVALNEAGKRIDEDYEIVVADDASTDRTADLARTLGARIVKVARRQIAATRNAGARESSGDKLIFVDADTVVSNEVVRAAVEAMNGGAVGGGSAVTFDGRLPRYAEIINPTLVRTFRALRLACGCFVFCTREAFDKVGGFDEELFASEEISISRALKRLGKFIVLREPVTTSGRKLRIYSGREILRLFARFIFAGPKALKQRDGLEVWYGGRRDDPDPIVFSQRQPSPEVEVSV